MKHKLLKIFLPLLTLCFVIAGIFIFKPSRGELRNISSDAELYKIYQGTSSSGIEDSFLLRLLTLPFSGFIGRDYPVYYEYDDVSVDGWRSGMNNASSENEIGTKTNGSDYSTTNIQVENVDEADIIKTDGNYMYSLSGSDAIITDVRDPEEPTVVARITSPDNSAPEDLILTSDVLAIISSDTTNQSRTFYRNSFYYNNQNTIVRVYDIHDRTNPRLEKSYTLHEPYYTSRRIDNQLYVIASGRLRAKDSKVTLDYEEDYVTKAFPATSVRYLKDVKTDCLTIVSRIDLTKLDSDITLEPFLLDISNAYVSENAFYLLDEQYYYDGTTSFWDEIKPLFGLKGVYGFFEHQNRNYYDYSDYGYKTNIYKFNINKSGDISYEAKTKIAGTTINQYSLDEKDGHLRLALEDEDGSYIAVFDEHLNKLGESGHLASGEKMYASRFIGDKAYLVTYRNTDPLFVIDLKNESNPKVLGELKIPGYSVYLHPYDEDHLIGIGIDTEEEIRRDRNGRVISTTAYITGMKLALFDVSDNKNPKEISKIKIGDSLTSSAILTNPKALLFSKEKQLLAIPVNNYIDEFKIQVSDTNNSIANSIERFRSYDNKYVSEGYIVYNINLEDGITEKGSIVHEDSQLIRGAYIGDNLITVSENELTINALSNLSLISELNLTNK